MIDVTGFWLAAGIGAPITLLGGAFALGIRHGIDWDHIAAITDITSTANPDVTSSETALLIEPGLSLNDEEHHRLARGASAQTRVDATQGRPPWSRRPIALGMLYALGHGSVVTVLGIVAIVAAGFLPAWVDPIMGRIVGVTLILLAGYLYYSVYRYLRGGGEFRLRSRWMLLFASVSAGYHWLTSRLPGHRHEHEPQMASQEYGVVSAFSIGMIHGIGAETGTQVLLIATAVGAASKFAGIVALLTFVAGLLVSNLLITIASTVGFTSVRRRQTIYLGIGLIAATFSLVLGLLFIFAADGRLPSLDPIVSWIGGPED